MKDECIARGRSSIIALSNQRTSKDAGVADPSDRGQSATNNLEQHTFMCGGFKRKANIGAAGTPVKMTHKKPTKKANRVTGW